MAAAPELPTWQIVPVAGGHFRWVVAGDDPGSRPKEMRETLAPGAEDNTGSRLLSIPDLLQQAPPELLDGGGGVGGGAPMFRTGSGRAVSVRQSSIRKSRSFLEDGDTADRGPLSVAEGGEGFSMFNTGSGKSVPFRESLIKKAMTVLEGETVGTESLKPLQGDDRAPLFHTGSGKSLLLKQSSIRKAISILQDEGNMETESLKPLQGDDRAPLFHTGSGKSVLLKQSSIRKALSILQDEGNMETDQMHKYTLDGGHNFSDSLFQTGSGKTVNITSAGLLRATTLLGLEGNCNLSTSKSSEDPMDQLDMNTRNKLGNTRGMARESVNHGTTEKSCVDLMDIRSVKRNSHNYSRDFHSSGNHTFKDALQNPVASELLADCPQSPIKFHTARGRSISISSDALQRARNLLGDSDLGVLHNAVKAEKPISTMLKDENNFDEASWNKENISCTPQNARCKHGTKVLPRTTSFFNTKQPSSLGGTNAKCLMLNPVNANGLLSDAIHRSNDNIAHMQKPSNKDFYVTHSTVNRLGMIPARGSSGGPLVEISNNIDVDSVNMYQLTSEKKRLGRISSISPFKRPRNSRFSTPLNSSISFLATGSSMPSTSENHGCRARVSTRYPFLFKRTGVKDFFGGPPSHHNLFGHLPDDVKHMNADNADKYRFNDVSDIDGIGPEAFQNMLRQVGASLLHATKEWVANHYKWIVWKLASFERCYPAHARGTYLTVPNVLEELKYRYEKEFNYGHRSAIKRILDGDASPASMMVLCVSAIRTYSKPKIGNMDNSTDLYEDSKRLSSSTEVESYHAAKIELTDGWYSLDALLDVSLSKQLAAGKLFVGQKLRIWGAGLCGWVGPVSSLEASKAVGLLIHINGTYRAHWADSLGFCKDLGPPLAFRCINGGGGKVPRTLVGVTRIYPILYKERFSDGGSIVRSERMEKKALQLYNQRRSNIAEDIMSEQQDTSLNGTDNEEGARIFKILESAAEPEMIMADMSSEQLISFSTYQAKQQEIRQYGMQKKIEKSLEDAGLSSREVTPFMRVRVVGLTSKGSCKKGRPREGLITIWNPSEKQKLDLVEGHIYLVAGLMPLNFSANIIYLQARGSSTVWKSLPATEMEKFEPFFTPRKSVLLSNLGGVPLASEFDLAAVIVHVGDVYIAGHQKKQWIFMTDGSRCSSKLQLEGQYDCLLAVSFCSPMIDNDSSPILSQCLSGATVGFCNLVKRARDQMNQLWVAEATENSTYSLSYNLPCSSHLKEAVDSAQKWEKESFSTIQMLRERALCIIGGDGS